MITGVAICTVFVLPFAVFLYKQQLVIYKQTAGCWITIVKNHVIKAGFCYNASWC